MTQHTLKNGLNVYLAPVDGTSTSTVLVMTKVGSRYEPADLAGASHFIEHMMFKGSRTLPTPGHVARALDAVGADYNAYTSKEYTGYYAKTASQHQEFAIRTLFDMTFDSLYNKEEMDRERNVIIEEIHMYEDSPTRHIGDLLAAAIFDGNTLGRDIAGSPDTVKTMDRDQVLAFRDQHYVPSRMSIAVAGKVDERVLEWLEETFGTIGGESTHTPYEPYAHTSAYSEPPVAMQTKASEQVHLGLAFPGVAYSDPRLPAMRVLRVILGGNMSSRLFMSVREKGGLAYRISAGHSTFQDTGMFSIIAGLDKSRVKEAVERTFEEVRDLMHNGPTAEELQRTKQFVAGHVTMAMEDSSSRAEWYAKRGLFMDAVQSPEEMIKGIEAVSAKDVQALAQEIFDINKMAVSYIGALASPDDVRALLPKNL